MTDQSIRPRTLEEQADSIPELRAAGNWVVATYQGNDFSGLSIHSTSGQALSAADAIANKAKPGERYQVLEPIAPSAAEPEASSAAAVVNASTIVPKETKPSKQTKQPAQEAKPTEPAAVVAATEDTATAATELQAAGE